ncbi:hypothetical protein POM88_029272 [Heracleum sosnowskyi]|uniref:Uncharacterized protein n=1 Tax=Heracleum sosnowskyi TaxID=360622 RepID=A0AAD8HUM1_9APIA|nr:hypothetical protein POM88_029272 [Heracleum sosnowskyi]
MCGILCRHAFCALRHYEVTKLSRNLVLNRWSKNAENAPLSIKLLGVSDDFKRMETASLKQTNIWFSFQKSMNKARVNLDKLAYVEKTVKPLVSDLGDDSYLCKKAHIEMLMGPHPREDLTIHVPKECSNKGSGLKRLVSAREKAIKNETNVQENASYVIRLCMMQEPVQIRTRHVSIQMLISMKTDQRRKRHVSIQLLISTNLMMTKKKAVSSLFILC